MFTKPLFLTLRLAYHYVFNRFQGLLRHRELADETIAVRQCKTLPQHIYLIDITDIDDVALAYTHKPMSHIPQLLGQGLLRVRQIHRNAGAQLVSRYEISVVAVTLEVYDLRHSNAN